MAKQLVTLVVDEANFNEATERWDIRLTPQDGWLYYEDMWQQSLRPGRTITLSLTEDWVAEVGDAPMGEPPVGSVVFVPGVGYGDTFQRIGSANGGEFNWLRTGANNTFSWQEIIETARGDTIKVLFNPEEQADE